MVVEEHMVCVAFNRMCCATYWFNPNILVHEKHYSYERSSRSTRDESHSTTSVSENNRANRGLGPFPGFHKVVL